MSAARLLWRWNQRMARREARQLIILVLLVAAAVGSGVAATGFAFNLGPPPEQTYGHGHARATVIGDAREQTAAFDAAFDPIGVIESATVPVAGSLERIDVRVQAADDEVAAPLVVAMNGRWPVAADEVALTDGVAGLLDVEIGRPATIGVGEFDVVGIIENPTDLGDEFALVTSLETVGATTDETVTSYLIDASVSAIEAESVAALGVEDPGEGLPPVRTMLAVATSVVVTIAMVQVALLASAGFAVISRRRTRQYGLLAAIGSTPRTITRSAIGLGAVTGAIGAVAGTAIAVWAVLAVGPSMEESVGHRISIALPWWTIAPGVIGGIAASTVASWWPARAIARQSVVRSLAARRPANRPVGSTTRKAAVCCVLGVVAILAGASEGEAWLVAGGAAIAITGILLTAPMVVRTIGSQAHRLALAGRIAGRSLGRQRSQSAVVVAAIAMALGVAVATTSAVAAVDARTAEEAGDLAPNMAILRSDVASDSPTLIPAEPFAPDDDLVDRLDTEYPTLSRVPIEVVVEPGQEPVPADFVVAGPSVGRQPEVLLLPAPDGSDDVVGFGELDRDGEEIVYVAERLWLATPAMVEAVGIGAPTDRAAVVMAAEDADLVGDARLVSERTNPASGRTEIVAGDIGPGYSKIASAFITPTAAHAAGLEQTTVGWLIVADRPFDDADRAALRSLVAGAGVIEFREEASSSGAFRLIVVVLASLLGIIVLIAQTTLTRMELAADLWLFAAIGATPRTTRKVQAASGGLLAAGGVLLALPFGLLVQLGMIADADTSFGLSIPWVELAVIVVVFPVVAMLVSAVGSAGRS